jgi:hypothetical protein
MIAITRPDKIYDISISFLRPKTGGVDVVLSGVHTRLPVTEMVDRRAKTKELSAAVKARDPFVLAKVLNVPSVSPVKGSEPKPPKESLQEGGTDWSNVLNAWLGACEAAEAVSFGSLK